MSGGSFGQQCSSWWGWECWPGPSTATLPARLEAPPRLPPPRPWAKKSGTKSSTTFIRTGIAGPARRPPPITSTNGRFLAARAAASTRRTSRAARHSACAASPLEELHIEANSIFGGIELRVPEAWTITVKGVGIFGGYEDKTLDARIAPTAKQPHLIVSGLAMFGGVTVRN